MCAGLDLHSHMETCGPWGGAPAGPRGHCGENFWSTQQEGSTTIWLWPSAGETGSLQGPNSAITYEGKFKKVSSFFTSHLCLLLALHVPAAASAAAADGELPGQGRAVPGQVAALCNQTLSPHSTVRDPQPQRTHGVSTIVIPILPNLIHSTSNWCPCHFAMQLVRRQTMGHSYFGATFTPKSFAEPRRITPTAVHRSSQSSGERLPWRHSCDKTADTSWAERARLQHEAVRKCVFKWFGIISGFGNNERRNESLLL